MISISFLLLLPIISSGGYVKPYHHISVKPANLPVSPAYIAASPNLIPVSPSHVPVSSPYVPVSPSTFTRSSFPTNDVVTETQTQAANLIKILTKFSADQRVVDFVATNYGNSSCVNNLQEAITATQFASDLITRSGPQLSALINTFNQLKIQKDPVVLIRGAATMLQQLDVLIPKLAKSPLSTQCRNSPEATLSGMKDLARIIDGLGKRNPYKFPALTTQKLQQSAIIVDASTDFVASIRNIFKNNDQFCSSDSQYNSKAVDALEELFNEVEKLVKALGSNFDISAIKQRNKSFARSLVENVNKLQEIGIGFVDCNTAGSYNGTADTLLEVADVVQEIGLENLERQLGVKFNFQL